MPGRKPNAALVGASMTTPFYAISLLGGVEERLRYE
jgi:hypothetical protein